MMASEYAKLNIERKQTKQIENIKSLNSIQSDKFQETVENNETKKLLNHNIFKVQYLHNIQSKSPDHVWIERENDYLQTKERRLWHHYFFFLFP